MTLCPFCLHHKKGDRKGGGNFVTTPATERDFTPYLLHSHLDNIARGR